MITCKHGICFLDVFFAVELEPSPCILHGRGINQSSGRELVSSLALSRRAKHERDTPFSSILTRACVRACVYVCIYVFNMSHIAIGNLYVQ